MTKKNINEMSFLDHLEDLRWHLIRIVISILIAATVAFLMKSLIFDTIIFGPSKSNFLTYETLCNTSRLLGFDSFCNTEFNFKIQSRTMAGQFSAHIWTSITFGFIIAFPYIIYQLWKFISPAMHDTERKYARGFIVIIMRKYRKFALVGVLILAAIITPPDIASQVIVAIPIIILYQVSIYISKVVIRNQEKKERRAKKTAK